MIGLSLGLAGLQLWGWYHLEAARSALGKNRLAEAHAHLESWLGVRPNDAAALLLAAQVARRFDKFDEAGNFLDRYRTVRGEDDDFTLESLLLQAQRGHLNQVKKVCLTLIKQGHPAVPQVLEAMARGNLRWFRLQEALICLKQWQVREPDNPQAYYLEGMVYDQNGHALDAVASYRKVLELAPDQDQARLRLAGHLLDMAQAQEAFSHLEYLEGRQPENPAIQVYLARSLAKLGQTVQAAKILDEVLARHPDYPSALLERGVLARQNGQGELAEEYVGKAAVLDPSNSQAHYQHYLCLMQRGKKEEARKAQERMKAIENDVNRIQEIVIRKMQVTPHDPALHYEIGMIALRAGSHHEALRWLESTIRLDPNFGPAHAALADYYQRSGSPGRAAHHRRQAQAALHLSPVVQK